MENSMNNRVMELRKNLGLSREAFAERLRTSQFVIRNIEYGLTEVKPMLIEQICDVFGVNKDWIVTGEGEMFKSRQTEDRIIEAFGRVVKMPDDAFVKQFVAALAELSPDDWKRVEEFARRVVEGGLKNEKDD